MSIMLAVLPYIGLILMVIFFDTWSEVSDKKNITILSGNGTFIFSIALSLWGILIFVFDEVLSLFHAITRTSVLILWITVAACMCILTAKLVKVYNYNIIRRWNERLQAVGFEKWFILAFFMLLLILSLWTFPFNSDSMTYHLPRIMHWVQNGSIEHYAAIDAKQLGYPWFAEAVNMHIYLLAGKKDYFLNLLQCFTFLSNGIFVLGIAKKLRITREWQLVTLLLYYSMPIAFSEALTTQNDNFGATWLLIFVYLLLDLTDREYCLKQDAYTIVHIICMGISISLGYLTKPTSLYAMLVFLIWLFVCCIRRRDSIKAIFMSAILATVCVILPIVPDCIRNKKTFDVFLFNLMPGQTGGTLDVRLILLCFLKNYCYNLPTGFLFKSSDNIVSFLTSFADKMGVDINDSAISIVDYELIPPEILHCDYAANPLIAWLLLIVVVLGIIYMIRKRKNVFNAYFLCSLASFVWFLSTLKFTAHRTRYEIGYFAILCPATVFILQQVTEKIKWKKNAAISILGFLGAVSLCNSIEYHTTHALEQRSRFNALFYNNEIDYIFTNIREFITRKGYKNIGFHSPPGTYEYPLWVALTGQADRIESVNSWEPARKYEDPEFVPDCIVWRAMYGETGEDFLYHDVLYTNTADMELGFYVFVPENSEKASCII